MRRGKIIARRFLAILIICLIGLGSLTGFPVTAKAQGASVVISVEKFSLGKGWIVEPDVVPITENETVASVLTRYMEEQGYPLVVKKNSSYGWYLVGIENADDGGALNIPSFIRDKAKKDGYTLTNDLTNTYAPTLQEFSYSSEKAGTTTSGWIYSVNDEIPSYTMDSYKLKNNDVVRLQFTLYGTGLDISGKEQGTTLYTRADKTALLTKLAYINQAPDAWLLTDSDKEAYEQACKVAQKLNATKTEVENAVNALPQNAVVWPETVVLSQTSLNLYDNDSAVALSAKVYPEETSFTKVTWSSENPEIAEVDEQGRVTPHNVGETVITATAQNGVSASCTVTVANRPYTSISLDKKALNLEAGNTSLLEVLGEPVNATEELKVSWESSDEAVASVSDTGEVTAKEAGTAVITAKTESGLSASCQVTVGNAKELAESAKTLIEALPDAGKLALEDAVQVKEANDAYQSLSEVSKGYLENRSELEAKLSRCVSAMETLEKKYTNVTNAESLITALPSLSALSMKDKGAVEAADAAYDALSEAEKALIDSASLKKLQSVKKRLSEMSEEIWETSEALSKISDEITLDDTEVIADAAELYDALEEQQKAQLSTELVQKLEDALTKLAARISGAADAVDTTKSVSLENAVTGDFVKGALARDLLFERLGLSQETEDKITAGKNWLKSGLQTKSGVSTDADWFVANTTEASDKTNEALKAIQKKYPDAKEGLSAFEISYQDIRTGKAYEPEKKLPLTITIKKLSKMEHPMVFTYIDGKLKKLEITIDKSAGTLTVKSDKTGLFVIADVPIPLTGLDLATSASVTKGGTLSLSPVKVPKNATTKVDYIWKSSDTSIATVDANGTVTGKKEGTVTITVSADGVKKAKASCKVTVISTANALSKTAADVIQETKSYILSSDKNPTVGSEWYALGLARSGLDLNDSYFTTYYNHFANYLEEKKGILTDSNYSDYSKAALTLTAIGKDARDIAGYNLFSYLADFSNVKKQGLNGPIWVLIALKSNPDYSIPTVSGVSEQTTETKLVDYIVGKQLADGGWAFTGSQADSDMTGMALQALAPYYNKKGYEKVTAAINKGLYVLGKIQLKTGGYGTMGTETSESGAQVLNALCALGIDPQSDARFIKNGKWLVENMISYHIDNSGFMHVKPGAGNNGGAAAGEVDGLATAQGMYSLVAYQRFLDGKTSLYDMSDLKVAAGAKGDGKGTGVTDPKANESTSNPESTSSNSGNKTSASSSGSSSAVKSSGSHSATTSSGRNSAAKSTANTSEKKNNASGSNASATNSAAKKTASDSKKTEEKKEKEGWSFDGEEYVPDEEAQLASADEGDKSATKEKNSEEAKTKTSDNASEKESGSFVKENLPWILCILCGAAVIGVCIYFKKKK